MAGNVLFVDIRLKSGETRNILLQSGATEDAEMIRINVDAMASVMSGLEVALQYPEWTTRDKTDANGKIEKALNVAKALLKIDRIDIKSSIEHVNFALEGIRNYVSLVVDLIGRRDDCQDKTLVVAENGSNAALFMLKEILGMAKDIYRAKALRILLQRMNKNLDPDEMRQAAEDIKSLLNKDTKIMDRLVNGIMWLRRSFHTEIQLAVLEYLLGGRVIRILSTYEPCRSCELINQIHQWYSNGAIFFCCHRDKDKKHSPKLSGLYTIKLKQNIHAIIPSCNIPQWIFSRHNQRLSDS